MCENKREKSVTAKKYSCTLQYIFYMRFISTYRLKVKRLFKNYDCEAGKKQTRTRFFGETLRKFVTLISF